MSDGQELIPIEQLTQPGLEEAEAASEQALVALQVSQVDFYGDELMAVLVEIGGERQVLVPLRQFCQYLGVDWASQYQRTKRGHEPPHRMRGLGNRYLRVEVHKSHSVQPQHPIPSAGTCGCSVGEVMIPSDASPV